jgi:hypothetical protein
VSQSKETRVFILGAGCSVECGYPLGTGLTTEFENFLGEIPTECPKIKQSVTATIDLLRRLPGTETLDRLAARVEQDLNDWKRQRGSPYVDAEYLEREKLAAKEILDAKIAMSAMFLAREERARQMRLLNYKRFITHILGGPPWMAAREAECHVLTFNYDRLFEIAFSQSFTAFDQRNGALYGGDVLNSVFEFNLGEWSVAQPISGRFSFVKLHGSAGWWVKAKREDGRGARRYWPAFPVTGLTLEEIEKSIPKERGGPFGWSPLLAFPHERQESQEYFNNRAESSGYDWAPYIDAVWKHAASAVADATEVRVIGYSFDPIDSRYMVNELLSKATCEKIVIQNKVDVRSNLESYKQLRARLDFDPAPF